MENEIGKYTRSFGISVAVASMFSGLLVILKELSEETVLGWMKRVTVHHWVTHALLDLLLFVAVGLLLTKVDISSERLAKFIVAGVVVGGLLVAGFYLIVG
jgi:hypothetical protein